MHFPKRPDICDPHPHAQPPAVDACSLAALAHAALAGERLQRALTPRGGEGDGVPRLARVLVLSLLVALVGVRLLRGDLCVDVHAGV